MLLLDFSSGQRTPFCTYLGEDTDAEFWAMAAHGRRLLVDYDNGPLCLYTAAD